MSQNQSEELNDPTYNIPYYNEACANCGIPADLHKGPNDQVSSFPHSMWGDVDTCRNFVRCNPPKAAYGELPEQL